MNEWQDIVISVGAIIFALALWPSILSKDKPALWTSLVTGIVLFVFALTYGSLSLWYAAATTAITASLWIVLVVQKILQARE
jgi:hypothetical protein